MEIPVIFFLSAVSREFHHPDPVAPQRFVSYRAHLAESLRAIRQPHDIISRADIIARDNVIRRADPDAQPGQIAVASQENLAQGFGDLLESLEDEVRNATVVVHLVGDMAGVAPKAASRRRLAERHPDFLGSEPELRDRLGNRADITYTQWELYFAYHHGCRRLVFTADSDAPRSPAFVHDKKQIALQHAHRARIEVVDKHTSAFTDQKDLVRQTIDNLIRRGLIADPGVSEPDPKAIDAARALLESIVPEIFAFSKKSDRAKVPLLDLAGVAAWIAALDTVAANHGLNRRHLCALLDEHLALLLEKADASADPAPYLDLAFTYFALARYPAAIATARRAIVLAEALPSDDERGIVTRRKHLLNGWNLIHSAAAQNHDHQLAAQALQNGGANIDKTKDPVLWADYHEPLVEHYIAHAQWQPAEDLLSEIVDIREELPGESSRALANTLNLWATLLYHTAKYPGTASVAGRAAQLFADALPPDTTGLAAALNNQASALQSLDRHSEAEPLMRRALGVEAQEVVQRLAESGDGRAEIEGVMRTMPVVVVKENREAS